MRIKLASYALVGIEAVPMDMVAGGHRAEVVEPETGRILHSVRLDKTESEGPAAEHVVNVRILCGGKIRFGQNAAGKAILLCLV